MLIRSAHSFPINPSLSGAVEKISESAREPHTEWPSSAPAPTKGARALRSATARARSRSRYRIRLGRLRCQQLPPASATCLL
ncbi:unnamed protein product, partial [Iphiclides podalirius]